MLNQLINDSPNVVRYPFRKNIRPGFVGDFMDREHVLAGGMRLNAPEFNGDDAIVITTGTQANAAATTIPVASIGAPVAVPYAPAALIAATGAMLYFGSGVYARLTQNLLQTDTVIHVEALPAIVPAGSIARYLQLNTPKRVAAGNVVGWKWAEIEAAAASGLAIGPAADDDDEVRITAYDTIVDTNGFIDRNFPMDIYNIRTANDVEVLRRNTLIYINFLPAWPTLTTAVKAKIHAQYECSVGAPGQEVPTS